jgi:hypothetical protein
VSISLSVLIRQPYQPSSDGFPEGLPNQPLYGWVKAKSKTARLTGFTAGLPQTEPATEKDAEAPSLKRLPFFQP